MINREKYIAQIRPFYESDLIKVITGIRRCGKSVVLEQIKNELATQDKRIVYLNFEDRRVSASITNDLELTEYVENELSDNHNEKLYVFLDEVQMVKNWNLACRSLRLQNVSLFITGSNSKLLSREFTKELSGRYVSFTIKPFVYKEILEYAKELGREVSINDYLIYGGFPKRFEFPGQEEMLRYLNDLDETIVLNDIINRYNIRKQEIFKKLVNYALMSNARIFSSNSVHRHLKSQKTDCSINTVMKYIDYLEEAYVVRKLPQYSTKAKKQLEFYTKLYDEDVAFNSIRQPNNRFDITHNLENVIYNELVYMGYNLTVYNVNDKEIDFLAVKNGQEYLVQVAYSVVEESAYKREFAAFNELDNSRKKILITNDENDFSTSTVQHIRLADFLKMNDLKG
ncbi:MAG: ATP-binding protein [Salinivirgaceae bacterium]|nr:ATP-binding protein [Salinivirgaceae bacterium]